MRKNVTYNLLVNNSDSDAFYRDLRMFTNIVLDEADYNLSTYLNDYYLYIQKTQPENPRSRNEYLLELIMIGIFWRNYIHKAEKTAYLSKVVLQKLYKVRKSSPLLKPAADKVRGYLAYELLNSDKTSLSEHYSLNSYLNLLEWLSATGEFNEELIRLNQWSAFFKTLQEKEVEALLRSTILFSNKFKTFGKDLLGKYTEDLNKFIFRSLPKYAHREDYFLAARKENEYFLNMFGAEIMNHQLQKEFEQTSSKAVLLPTCMRTEPKDGCKAISDGKELVCARCNNDCTIGKIASSLAKEKVTAYLIPHSSDFSKFLVKWKGNRETGLIGVACVLNLLTGGYEMKRLNIASQCVFLDYCGCKKHWDKDGFATSLNINQLKQIVQKTSVHEKALISEEKA